MSLTDVITNLAPVTPQAVNS